MKKEKILKIIILLILIIIFSVAIAVIVLKYNNKSKMDDKPLLTKETAIEIVENNYDTLGMVLDAEEREDYFIVNLRSEESNEIVKSYSVLKKNNMVLEIKTTTAQTG